jgi:hypothetical protein
MKLELERASFRPILLVLVAAALAGCMGREAPTEQPVEPGAGSPNAAGGSPDAGSGSSNAGSGSSNAGSGSPDAGGAVLGDSSFPDDSVDVAPPLASGATETGADAACAGQPPVAYTLSQAKNFAAPLPNPAGIAYDGQALWILAPGGSGATLVHFNPATFTTDRTLDVRLSVPPGTGVYGITWDGQYIWVSVSGDSNELAVVDPTSGQVVREMSSPTMLGPSDLDFDGTDLWMSTGTGDVYRLDRTSGGIVQHFSPICLSDGRDQGVAVRPGEIWVGRLFGGLDVYDSATGAEIGQVLAPGGVPFTQEEMGPTCFVGTQLAMLGPQGITYFDVTKSP